MKEVLPYGGGGVMVWGGISAEQKTDLVLMHGKFNGLRYRDEILEPHVLPRMKDDSKNLLYFQEDNATPHKNALCQTFLRQNGVPVLPWPARSPDLSPIEHIWDVLGRRVTARTPRTVQELGVFFIEEWGMIQTSEVKKYIRSMKNRVDCVISARGGHTKY